MMYQFRKMFVHRDFMFCTVLDLRVTCVQSHGEQVQPQGTRPSVLPCLWSPFLLLKLLPGTVCSAAVKST